MLEADTECCISRKRRNRDREAEKCKCTKRALSTPTVHTMDREKERGKDSLLAKSSLLLFFLKYFLYFLSYSLIPRHTGRFLVASGHCQTLSTERGSLQFICMCYTFIHVVNLEINIRDDLPGSNTMWNDIIAMEEV